MMISGTCICLRGVEITRLFFARFMRGCCFEGYILQVFDSCWTLVSDWAPRYDLKWWLLRRQRAPKKVIVIESHRGRAKKHAEVARLDELFSREAVQSSGTRFVIETFEGIYKGSQIDSGLWISSY